MKGICLSSNANQSNLIISGFISKPFEFENSNYLSCISGWIFRNIVYNIGFLVYDHMKDPSIFDYIVFKTVFKAFNLDDSTPIDNTYHLYSAEIATNDLIKSLEFDTDLEYLIRSSKIEKNDHIYSKPAKIKTVEKVEKIKFLLDESKPHPVGGLEKIQANLKIPNYFRERK